ncbi:hypothetical protein [Aliamphritea spongicola]|nr:hypothetical protein [Aliamphritea spongicola]
MPDLDAQLDSLLATAEGSITVTEPPKPVAAEQQSLFADDDHDAADVGISPDIEAAEPQARTFARRLLRDWRISSYSALTSHASHSCQTCRGWILKWRMRLTAAPIAARMPRRFTIFLPFTRSAGRYVFARNF